MKRKIKKSCSMRRRIRVLMLLPLFCRATFMFAEACTDSFVAIMRERGHFKYQVILLMWTIFTAAVDPQHVGRCPPTCSCHAYYHPTDGPSVRVECRIGGMEILPVNCLERDIHQLIIAPPPDNPNNLIIGPVLTQPNPFYNIRDLTLAYSNIPTIGKHSFWGLRNLRNLNLTGNNLTSITTDNFRGLVNLAILTLDDNQINQMASETFRHMESLTRLSLAHNHITVLVPRLFRMLGKLERLELSFNPIYDLNPEVFKDIQNLVIFKCRKCFLSRVNVQIYHIAPLIEELDLGDNLFKYLTDDDFRNLKKLKTLYIDRNQLSVIVDNVFKGNGQLRNLDVSHNRIALLAPGSLNNLSGLVHLDIGYNRLEKFRLQAFAPVAKSLQTIGFSGNNLQLNEIALPLQILPDVQDVKLANLSLKAIPPNFFVYNKRLQALDISSNLLTQFPYTLLTSIRLLQYLDISNNKLTSLNDSHLRQLEAIAKINLSHNTWHCDFCSAGVMLSYMQTTVLNETIRELRCHTPLRLRGVFFSELTIELLEPCFTSYEAQISIVAGLLLVLMSVIATGTIALCCTRRRGAQYYTNEGKRRERDPDHPEELLVTTNNGSVSIIHSPCHHAQNNS